jgi:hypothetical protein
LSNGNLASGAWDHTIKIWNMDWVKHWIKDVFAFTYKNAPAYLIFYYK